MARGQGRKRIPLAARATRCGTSAARVPLSSAWPTGARRTMPAIRFPPAGSRRRCRPVAATGDLPAGAQDFNADAGTIAVPAKADRQAAPRRAGRGGAGTVRQLTTGRSGHARPLQQAGRRHSANPIRPNGCARRTQRREDRTAPVVSQPATYWANCRRHERRAASGVRQKPGHRNSRMVESIYGHLAPS